MGSLRIVCLLGLTAIVAEAATNREVAEWVIRWEGRVILEGSRKPIRQMSQIPADGFEIVGIDLTGAVMHPMELQKLAGLTTLRELYLPGPIWNPGGGNEDGTDVFKAIGTLKNLEKLYVGWHYHALTNIRDAAFSHLTSLTSLKEIRCEKCRITNFSMASFSKLESLDLSYSPFSDKGMEGLAGLKNLKRLILRDSLITDAGLKHVAGLVQLEELDLSGTATTERGLENLRGMTGMRKLNLLGAQATDATMEILAGMKRLKTL